MKPRRDITLGEMQDECKRVECKCEKCDRRISLVCGSMINSNGYFETPNHWDLTDPPRFTEAQMALLRALWELGARSIVETRDGISYVRSENRNSFARFNACIVGINDGETLDLADLLGKDAT